METEQVAIQPTVGSIAQTPQNAFVVPNGELKDFYLKFAHLTMHAWDDGIPEILLSCGAYSLQDDLNKKTRMQMNASMGKHLQFLTQMAMDSPAMKLLYRNMNKHYMQVEILVKQMATEIERQKKENGQQEIMKTIP